MRYAITAALLLLGSSVLGQPSDTGIVLNLDLGYNTAYRDGTWVPVDVFVENKQRDFSGWVEVRVYDVAGALQSPTYRVAADCPQNSKKRFRLYAWIDHASRVEAVLYENDRLAVDVPAYIEPRPIDVDDFLAIVLDDDPLNYQFLYDALRPFKETRRISRKDIGSSVLGLLPDRLACLAALDFVIVGDVDLSRMTPNQRRLLLEYVEQGGTMAVFTGVQAQRVRDSWLDDYLGVDIESLSTQPEALYRAAVFGDQPPQGYDEARICTAATLTRRDPAVQLFGQGAVLAARRSYGNGHIVTFAIDAASLALQDDPRYIAIWHTLLRSIDRRPSRLNTDFMDMTFINNLPQISGVTIRPVSDVLIYLGLYIGIGIVLNWIVWSRIGRREYAWLTLLLVSFCFTAYAIVSGTSGFEGRKTRHSVSLLQLGKGSALALEYSLTGILSARVTEVDQPLAEPDGLVREAGTGSADARWGIAQSNFARPFNFVENPDPALNNLRVGANEVRGYSTTAYRRLPGNVQGTVDLADQTMTVSAENRTGIEFDSAVLYWRGQFYPLEPGDGSQSYILDSRPNAQAAQNAVFSNARLGGYWPGSFYARTWPDLISYVTLSPLMDEDTSAPNPYLGPYFIGRVDQSAPAPAGTHPNYSTTLVMAELNDVSPQPVHYPLAQRLGNYSRYTFPRDWSPNDWDATLTAQPLDLYLSVPGEIVRRRTSHIEVEMVSSTEHSKVVLKPVEKDCVYSGAPTKVSANGPFMLKRYRIPDWERYIDEISGDVHFEIGVDAGAGHPPISIHVNAEIVVDPPQASEEEWKGWQ